MFQYFMVLFMTAEKEKGDVGRGEVRKGMWGRGEVRKGMWGGEK